MMYELPKQLNVCGVDYDIRSDYRAVLDICAALSDVDLNEQEKAIVALDIMFPDFENMPPVHYAEAVKQCLWFINCGNDEEPDGKKTKLVDWEQDFTYIVAPVNRVLNAEIRELPYLHWWTFIGAYNEIGECTFAHIVKIRDKKARGKKLEKEEQEWYRRNQKIVDFKTRYSEKEEELLRVWGK